jgi:large subunit ribosomal protein L5
MQILESHYNYIVKHDLVTKFNYKNNNVVPKLQKIVLNFGIKEVNFKLLLPTLIALELVSSQKGALARSNKSNIALKIRKGVPVGCKVVLSKTNMYLFFSKIIITVLPKIKQFEGVVFKKAVTRPSKSFSFFFNNVLIFSELESQHELFKNTSVLDVSIVTNCRTVEELHFLLASFRFPIK